MFRRPWHLIACLLGLVLFDQPAEALQTPFVPSLRWTHSAPLSDPWIPESAFFGGGGEMIWASGNFGSPRLMLLGAPGEVLGEVLREDVTVNDSIAVLSATARSGSGAVFSIAQYANPDSTHRRTEISRYDPLAAQVGTSLVSSWERDAGFITNGPAKVVCDDLGRTVVSAVWNNSTGTVHLDWISGANGNLVRQLLVPMNGLNALDISLDGRRVLLCGGTDLYLFDTVTGVTLHHEILTASTQAVTLSGDGTTIAFGSFGLISVLSEVNSVIQPLITIPGNTNHMPTRADLSDDGNTLAIGWWNFVTAAEVRYEIADVATGMILNSYPQVSAVGGLQNFPYAVSMTRDGSRAAFGGWGAGGVEPEMLLVERGVQTPLLSVNLPGSVRSLDLDESGTRVVVGSKNVHANQFGTTGELRLYETGEQDLVQLSSALSNGNFEFAARRPGANAVLFLVGVRSFAPMPLGGFIGELALTRRLPMHIEYRPADATGRADADFGIPSDPHWTGHSLSVQALFRMGAGRQELSDTTLTPLIF